MEKNDVVGIFCLGNDIGDGTKLVPFVRDRGSFSSLSPPLASVANEGFAPLCGATAISMAALKTPVAPKGRELGKPNVKVP